MPVSLPPCTPCTKAPQRGLAGATVLLSTLALLASPGCGQTGPSEAQASASSTGAGPGRQPGAPSEQSPGVAPAAIEGREVTEAEELLRAMLEDADEPARLTAGDEVIYASQLLPTFYDRRGYALAWLAAAGPSPDVADMIEAIESVDREGLNPADYHLAAIRARRAALFDGAPPASDRVAPLAAELDALLSDAFLVMGTHLLVGRVDPETVHSDWTATRREADMTALLGEALRTSRIKQTLASLLPPQPGYARLRQALAAYRALGSQGEWKPIAAGPVLKRGARGPRVRSLVARLRRTGDLTGVTPDADLFDESSEAAVKLFQQRHGLGTTGVLDEETRAALNVPAKRRALEIELNLERWRWLPQDLGKRHILVNIPNFELDTVEDGAIVHVRRAVVGRDYRLTPTFSGQISHLVFNPTWTVPRTIAVNDILPQARRNPAYLSRRGIRVYRGRGGEAREVRPQDVPWRNLGPRRFPYWLRQDPGPQNALGTVKFMFPNRHHVYLHDTPAQDLFERSSRDFSSGCIRVERPMEIAEWLLASTPRWRPEAIGRVVAAGRERTARLADRVPVHLLYWTAFADDQGRVNFRRDLYGRDQELDRALHEPPPGGIPDRSPPQAATGRAPRRGR